MREIEPSNDNAAQSMPVSPKISRKAQIMKERPERDDVKDEFGITKKLRVAINKKYDVTEMIGNGSYGCVS